MTVRVLLQRSISVLELLLELTGESLLKRLVMSSFLIRWKVLRGHLVWLGVFLFSRSCNVWYTLADSVQRSDFLVWILFFAYLALVDVLLNSFKFILSIFKGWFALQVWSLCKRIAQLVWVTIRIRNLNCLRCWSCLSKKSLLLSTS
jgi:hypothetical protein